MIAFVATVVAWTTKPTCAAATLPSASARSTACMKPSEGSAGVVSTFAIDTAPDSSSISVASVKVPPMSTATRTLMGLCVATTLSHRLALGCEGRGRLVLFQHKPRVPQTLRRRLVEAPIGDRHAVDVARALGADLTLEHVAQHALGVAL